MVVGRVIAPFLVLQLVTVPALAGTAIGQISVLYARSSDGLQLVILTGGSQVGRPACASATTYYVIKDENSRAGQSQFAQLLSAQIAGKTIYIQGAGTFTRFSDAEDINWIQIMP